LKNTFKSIDPMICPNEPDPSSIQEYFLGHLHKFKGETLLSNLKGVDCQVGFEIETGSATLRFVLVLVDGAIEEVTQDWEKRPEIVYITNGETFYKIVGGWQRAESAFLRRRIRIQGNLLRGLKLAFLLQEFFDRFPFRPEDLRGIYVSESVPAQDSEPLPDSLVEEEIGIDEDLRIKAVYPEEGLPTLAVILVPPHPFLGGTSENRLLLKLSSALASRGGFVVRFDYRQNTRTFETANGVRSFWEDSDAGYRLGLEELQSIHGWMASQEFLSGVPILWVGYSYGAQVCLWAMENDSPDRQVFISPVVSQIREERLHCNQRSLVIGGSEDFATTPTEFKIFSESLRFDPVAHLIEGADHFYTGKEEELVETLLRFLESPDRTQLL
jgi:alpha/beta superfamily hydrolase/putative sterol carrier protein